MENKNPSKAKSAKGVTWPETVRDVLTEAIDKGQLLPLGLLFITTLSVWKMSGDQLREILLVLFGTMKDFYLLGWFSFVAVSVVSYFNSQKMRREFRQEFERIGREKSALQSEKAGVLFNSSDK